VTLDGLALQNFSKQAILLHANKSCGDSEIDPSFWGGTSNPTRVDSTGCYANFYGWADTTTAATTVTTYTGSTDAEQDESCCAKCRADPTCSAWLRQSGSCYLISQTDPAVDVDLQPRAYEVWASGSDAGKPKEAENAAVYRGGRLRAARRRDLGSGNPSSFATFSLGTPMQNASNPDLAPTTGMKVCWTSSYEIGDDLANFNVPVAGPLYPYPAVAMNWTEAYGEIGTFRLQGPFYTDFACTLGILCWFDHTGVDLKTDNKVVLVVPQDQNAPARYSECGRGDVTAAF
jgi:hypothetical protein